MEADTENAPKVTTGHHTNGAIVRIFMKDFLTYSEVEVRPGPNLNLILGPNGTGKSTIVCAICLGLCGKTSTILRGNKVGDYVRHRAKQALIEIELYNSSGKNFVISRQITRENNHSQWKLQGKVVPQHQVEALVKGLHIQVDNLCQFLPQEQVQNFSRFKDKELLIRTLEAIGAPELLEDLNKLKELQETRAGTTNERDRLEAELANARQDKERWEGDVQSFREREELVNRCEMLQKKQVWVEYSAANEIYQRSKEEATRLKREYRRATEELQPLQEAQRKTQTEVCKAQDAIRKKREAHNLSCTKAHEKLDEVNNKKQEIIGIKSEFETTKKQQAKKQLEIENQKRVIRSLETDLETVEDESQIIPELQKVEAEMAQISQKVSEAVANKEGAKDQVDSINAEKRSAQHRLRELQNVSKQRMDLLREHRKDVHSAVEWLRNSKHLFKFPIYEPLVLTLNVKNTAMAKYIEHRISRNDMFAFFCENIEDMNLLLRTLRDEKGWLVGAVHAPPASQPSSVEFQPRVSLDELRQFGFRSYLRELFTAPEPIMRYLCKNYKIHCIPVGTAQTAEALPIVRERYFDFFNIFFSDTQVFTIRKSRYSNQMSTQTEELHNAKFLSNVLNPDLIESLQDEIKRAEERLARASEEHLRLETEEANLNRAMEDLRNRKKDLNSRKTRRRDIMSRIEQKKNQLQRLQAQVIDIDAEEQEMKRKCLEVVKHIVEDLKKHAELLQQVFEQEKERETLQILADVLKARALDLQQKVEEERERYRQLEEKAQQAEREKAEKKTLAENCYRRALTKTGINSYNDFPEAEKAALDALPTDLHELEETIHELNARIQCMRETDPQILRNYETLKKRIEELTQILSSSESRAAELNNRVEEIRQRWLPPLRDLIGRINNSFSRYYASMNCAGEVVLFDHDNPDDFKNYGIKIRVKYRDSEPLQDLSAEHHSGGERAVATAMYMIALQELTQVPFRCVDEINQGMDAFNERRVFDLLVRTACHERTAQYFLLTPKLLPNLEYSRYMNILEIQNGKKLMNYKDWVQKDTHLAKLRALRG